MSETQTIADGLDLSEIKTISLMQPGRTHRVATFYPMLQRLRGNHLVDVCVGGSKFLVTLTPLGVAVRDEIQKKGGA